MLRILVPMVGRRREVDAASAARCARAARASGAPVPLGRDDRGARRGRRRARRSRARPTSSRSGRTTSSRTRSLATESSAASAPTRAPTTRRDRARSRASWRPRTRAGIPVDVCGEAAGDPELAAAARRPRRRRAERLPGSASTSSADDPRALGPRRGRGRPPRRWRASSAEEARRLARGFGRAEVSKPATSAARRVEARRRRRLTPRARARCRRWRPARAPGGCSGIGLRPFAARSRAQRAVRPRARKRAAGRACRSTPSGSRTCARGVRAYGHRRASSAAAAPRQGCTPWRPRRRPRSAPSTSGASARAAVERSSSLQLAQRGADGEHGAAEIDQHHRARRRVEASAHRLERPAAVGAEDAVRARRRPARSRRLCTRNLRTSIGQALGEPRRVGDQYRRPAARVSIVGRILQCRTPFDNDDDSTVIQSVDRAAASCGPSPAVPAGSGSRAVATGWGWRRAPSTVCCGRCRRRGSSSRTPTAASTSSARS